jgi:Methyltransferase domain
MWDERYSKPEYAYGTEPNVFLKDNLKKFEPSTILFPAEGEGRNAVYAATLGWDVSAFDLSNEGYNKAMKLAEENHIQLDYQVGLLSELKFKSEYFDMLALIYAHFPADIKSSLHQMLDKYVNINGHIIFEAFSKKHIEYNSINPGVGGPKDLGMLFSKEEILNGFKNYEVIMLEEVEIELAEGLYHNGKGSVIRFIGRKME